VSSVVPTSAEGIERYLAAGHVKGIRAGLARKLVARFDTDLLRIIDEEPNRLREVPGLGAKTLKKITESWGEQRGVRTLMVFLAQHGLGGARASDSGFMRQRHCRDPRELLSHRSAHRLQDRRRHGARLGMTHLAISLLAGCHIIESAREGGHCIPGDEAAEPAGLLASDKPRATPSRPPPDA
jgi:hypothetical protein